MDVVILAAGNSERMGKIYKKNKVLLQILGHPAIMYPIFTFRQIPEIDNIIVAYNPEQLSEFKNIFSKYRFNVELIPGGRTRRESVYNALSVVKTDKVLVHDGARVCIDLKTIEKVIEKLKESNAVIPAIKSTDTLKYIEHNVVKETVNRDKVYKIQTPQGFKTNLLKKAIELSIRNRVSITDDASAIEQFGTEVSVVDGNIENIKLTYEVDYMLAKAILYRRIKEKTENFIDKMRR